MLLRELDELKTAAVGSQQLLAAAEECEGSLADKLADMALVLVAMYSGRGIYLDIAIVTAILGFLSQVLIGKYLEGTL